MRKISKKIEKNLLIQKNFKSVELQSVYNKNISNEFGHLEPLYLYIASMNYKRSAYYSKCKLRCFLSGRTRAVLKKFMLSRMMFKKISLNGYITGLKKASW